jgi:hypothetical protein
VWITADDANTGKLYVGDNSVTSTGGGNVFTKLQAGQIAVMQLSSTSLLNVVGTAASQTYYVGILE